MTPDMPNTHFTVLAILIMLAMIAVLALYAKNCCCDSCRDPFAIFQRDELQLCRQCKLVYDRHHIHERRRRALPWRLWRRTP